MIAAADLAGSSHVGDKLVAFDAAGDDGGKKPTALAERLAAIRTGDGQEHDLSLVRQGRRGRRALLRRDFPDSAVGAVLRAPGDYPSGKAGDVLTVEFTVAGIPAWASTAAPPSSTTKPSRFRSRPKTRRDRPLLERDRRQWRPESACGWCKDKWGLSWQITPRVLTEAIAAGAEAKRAFSAMMDMRKIDIAKIKAARRG